MALSRFLTPLAQGFAPLPQLLVRSAVVEQGILMEKHMANERGGSGNFANDPKRASEAGKKGGEHSHGGQQHAGGSSRQQHGGSGNFANDPKRASEAGRKGGQH